MRPHPTVAAIGVTRIFGTGTTKVTAVNGVDIEVPAKTWVVILGASGSGKSTLLRCLSGLEQPDEGSVLVGEVDITTLRRDHLTRFRRRHIATILQSYNLVPSLSADENIRLTATLAGDAIDQEWFSHIVSRLGLGDRLHHRPGALSGGQQQRVAVARALVTRAPFIAADEPTGALDQASGQDLLDLFRDTVDEFGTTILMVTHDRSAARRADVQYEMTDGRLTTVEEHAPPASQVSPQSAEPDMHVTGGLWTSANFNMDHTLPRLPKGRLDLA